MEFREYPKHMQADCPSCGKALDSSTPVGHDHAPEPGDLTVCIGCASVNVYTEGMQLRRATRREMWHERRVIRTVQAAIRQMRAREN